MWTLIPRRSPSEMKRAASRFYGMAGPEFVRRLIERGIDGDIVRAKVAAFVDIALANEKDYHGQAGRAAERFGLVAAAGELAVELELLPWSADPRQRMPSPYSQDWLEARGGAVPAEVRQIIAKVRYFLEAHGGSRFEDLDRPPTRPCHLVAVRSSGCPIGRVIAAGRERNNAGSSSPRCGAKRCVRASIPPKWPRFYTALSMLEPGEDGKQCA